MTDINEPLIDPAESVMEKPDALTRHQVNQCLMEIEDNHPLRERVHYEHIMPAFKWCKKDRIPGFKTSLRYTMLAEMGIKKPKNDDMMRDDPFLYLGYGVNAYFNTMLNLSKMFGMITLFVIPLYMVYSGNNVQALKDLPKYSKNKFSLGNLGGSSMFCSHKSIKTETLTITCPRGTHIYYEKKTDVKFGVINKKLLTQDYCQEKGILEELKTQPKQDQKSCTTLVDHKFIHDQITKCMADAKKKGLHGIGNCHIILKNKLRSLYKTAPATNEDQCSLKSNFYLQIPCIVPANKYAARRVFGLTVGCSTAFIYIFIIVFFDYIKAIEGNLYIDFDINTVTAGDYTIEFDMPPESHAYFIDHYHNPHSPMSEIAQFKLYVQTELEARLSSMADLGLDDNAHDTGRTGEKKKIVIAQITFAYFNDQVITWLRKRGALIKTEKYELLNELNDEIDEGIKDQTLLDTLQKPCSCFVTFLTEEGYARAQVYNKQVQDKILPRYYGFFLEQPLDIQEASEPTDIIWENRQIQPQFRFKRSLIVWILIVIMIAISAAIIYVCSYTSIGLKLRYPITNCKIVTNEFVGEKAIFSMKEWEEQSFKEYLVNQNLKKSGRKTMYTEVMQCFCRNQGKKNQMKEYTMGSQKKAFCKVYFSDKITSKVLGQMIAFIIIAFNLILKTVIIKLISSIRYDTQSEMLSQITNGVFIAQFLNTGFVLLLVNSNMTEHSPKFITRYIASGQFRDYVPLWYSEVGAKILQTMIINSIMPYVTLATSCIIPKVMIMRDSKDPWKTKKTSMAQFKMLHSGKDYIIHFKFANVLNVIYISMMYGIGMPLLFPVAAFNLLNQYICERIIVAYYMKQPPALDNKLIMNCLRMLKYAPLLMLMNGYWMLSNKQIFENTYSYIIQKSDSMVSSHFPNQALDLGPATPVFLMTVFHVALIVIFIVNDVQVAVTNIDFLKVWGFSMTEKDIMVDEDLPEFFKSIPLKYADVLLKENEHMKDWYGFELNDPDTIELLIEAKQKIPKKTIVGTPWYQVTSNLAYSDDFCYLGPFVPEREKLIEDGLQDRIDHEKSDPNKGLIVLTENCIRERLEQSDLVLLLLNLAYIPDQVAKNLHFECGWSINFKELMIDFQKKWELDQELKWEFQNDDIEKEYRQYIKDAATKDLALTKRMTEDQIFDQMKNDLRDKLLNKINQS